MAARGHRRGRSRAAGGRRRRRLAALGRAPPPSASWLTSCSSGVLIQAGQRRRGAGLRDARFVHVHQDAVHTMGEEALYMSALLVYIHAQRGRLLQRQRVDGCRHRPKTNSARHRSRVSSHPHRVTPTGTLERTEGILRFVEQVRHPQLTALDERLCVCVAQRQRWTVPREHGLRLEHKLCAARRYRSLCA